MITALAALQLLFLVQGSAPAPPPVDQLHDALNIAVAKRGGTQRMAFSGCTKDDARLCAAMNMCRVTCYYELNPKVPVQAKADTPQGPPKSIEVKLPGDKENAERMVRVAAALALALIPNLSDADLQQLMQKLAAKSDNVFDDGERTAELAAFEFRYEASRKGTRLRVDSTIGTCVLGKTC